MTKRVSSKWLNSVSFNLKFINNENTDPVKQLSNILTDISSLEYIDKIDIVNQLTIPNTAGKNYGKKKDNLNTTTNDKLEINDLDANGNGDSQYIEQDSNILGNSTIVNGVDYGKSFYQLNQINVIEAHKLGYTGKGVVVLVIDTGFMKSHETLTNIKIVQEKDFIPIEKSTNDLEQLSHGTFVLSEIGGNKPGKYIGAAPGASFLLAKTEIVSEESPLEEDYLVEAIEWGESNGADIISISLSYAQNYEYWKRDGSSPISKSLDIANSKGIVAVSASGNDGELGVGPPGDSKLGITVGAVDNFGDVAIFSSYGPSADGRLKPEIVARGVLCYGADDSNSSSYRYTSGTSHSTPLVAGSIACLLEAHPNWTPKQVKEVLLKTSNQYPVPDNFKGFGLINILEAIKSQPSESCSGNANCEIDNGICIDGQCFCSNNIKYNENNGNDTSICSSKIRCSFQCKFNHGKCSQYDCFRCLSPDTKESSDGRSKCVPLKDNQETPDLSNASIIKSSSLLILLLSILYYIYLF